MKSKIINLILFIILILLVGTIAGFGWIMYQEINSNESSEIEFKFDGFATDIIDELTNRNTTKKDDSNNIGSIEENIYSNISTNNQEVEQETASLNKKFFYNQLNNTQRIIYNGLEDNKDYLKQGDYKISFGNKFSELLKQENGAEELGDDYQSAIEAFVHDHPEIFYLDVNKMYLNIQTTTKLLKTIYNVYISPAEGKTYLSDEFASTIEIEKAIIAIENEKNSILQKLQSTDYKNIVFIHDYLVDNIEYDSDYTSKGTYNIYGALIEHKCVCEGYAKAFKYLLNSAGYDCELLQGVATNSSGKSENHAWNAVCLNNGWYQVDVTWDDPIIIGNFRRSNNEIKYKYFFKGTNQFNKDHTLYYQFSEKGRTFAYPNLSETDYK